jgi:hypothetical protein
MAGGTFQVDNITNSDNNGPVNFQYGITGTSFIAPTVQKFLSGSGTYILPTTPRAPIYIKVKVVGGGGGGGGSGKVGSTGTTGTTGGTTTFGTLLIAAGGNPGSFDSVGSLGGSPTVNSPAISLVELTGGSSQGSNTNTAQANVGGNGGSSPFGGYGPGGSTGGGSTFPGGAAIANTGSGGGGAGAGNGTGGVDYTGSGGASGAYIEANIYNPNSSYTYVVGNGGNGGSAGIGGSATAAGGSGGSGVIIVEEYYQ